MEYFCIILFISLVFQAAICRRCYIELEAETGRFNGIVMERSSASDEHTVLLTLAERIEYSIRVFNEHLMEVRGLTYSNDGESDNISVSINGKTFGIVETIGERGEGHLWNVFRNSGPLEEELLVPPGEHDLQIVVTSRDLNGVEIDKISLELNCSAEECQGRNNKCPESVIVTSETVSSEADEEFKSLLSSPENTLGLAGVVIGGFFGVIDTTIILIAAMCKNCRKRQTDKKRSWTQISEYSKYQDINKALNRALNNNEDTFSA